MSFQPELKHLKPSSDPAKGDQNRAHASRFRSGRIALIHGLGLSAVLRVIGELLVGHRKILVSITDPPHRLNLVQSLVLSGADAVLATPDLVGALAQIGIAPNRVVTLGEVADRAEFMACPGTRRAGDAHRMVFVGNLSLHSGVTDFLSCAITWAERNPAVAVNISWLGEGDLLGVLRAQMLPDNLDQFFCARPAAARLPDIFCHAGLLVVPSLAHARAPWITEAMAAGLPVLGSVRSAQVRGLVVHHKTGWVFDPFSTTSTLAALECALTAPMPVLDGMRLAARARIAALHNERLGEDVDQTLRMRLAEFVSEDPLGRMAAEA